jgi:hypothetical protein
MTSVIYSMARELSLGVYLSSNHYVLTVVSCRLLIAA